MVSSSEYKLRECAGMVSSSEYKLRECAGMVSSSEYKLRECAGMVSCYNSHFLDTGFFHIVSPGLFAMCQ